MVLWQAPASPSSAKEEEDLGEDGSCGVSKKLSYKYRWWENSCTTWDVKRPCKQWDKLPFPQLVSWSRISEPSTSPQENNEAVGDYGFCWPLFSTGKPWSGWDKPIWLLFFSNNSPPAFRVVFAFWMGYINFQCWWHTARMGGLGRFLVKITLPSEIFTSSSQLPKLGFRNLKDSRDSGGISLKHELKVWNLINSVANIFFELEAAKRQIPWQKYGFWETCLRRQEEQDLNDPQLLDWRRDPEKPVILDLFGAADECGCLPCFVCGC